jgi:hypothetical protein
MSHLQQTVTCAFLSYGALSTTAKRCPRGVFLLTLRLSPLGWVPVRLTIFGSGLREFCLRRQAFLRRMLLVSKVCHRMSQHLRYLSLTEVRTSVFCSPGSRRCKTTYKKASDVEQKTTSELNILLESLSSWVADIDGPSGDATIDVVHPHELYELKRVWEKTRYFLRSALETLKSEPVHHHRSSLAFMHRRSVLRRWMTSLVRFS